MAIQFVDTHASCKTSDIPKRVFELLDHIKNRTHKNFDFLHIEDSLHKKISNIAMRLQSTSDHLVVIGMGGSALGAAALSYMGNHRDRVTVIDEPDPVYWQSVLARLGTQRLAVNVVSKSGFTLETWAQWSVLENILIARGDNDYATRVVMTSDEGDNLLRDIAQQKGFTHCTIKKEIGGRYSVFTAAGLLAASYAGVDLEEVKAGIQDALDALSHPNTAWSVKAGIQWANADLKEHKQTLVLWAYSYRLGLLARWFQQLFAESLAKSTHLDGRLARVGSTPLVARGPADQHSLLQLFREGPRNKFYVFFATATPHHAQPISHLNAPDVSHHSTDDDFHYAWPERYQWPKTSLSRLTWCQAVTTYQALTSQGAPAHFIALEKCDTRHFSMLLANLMIATIVASAIYGVDPFGQPGVELGKDLTKAMLYNPMQAHTFTQCLQEIDGRAIIGHE